MELMAEAGLTSKTTSLGTERMAYCPENGSINFYGQAGTKLNIVAK
jgi:hypothetical protein